jgi:vacuolar iron transporter family protein
MTEHDAARPIETIHARLGVRFALRRGAGLYIRDLVYGANDGLITTLAVVAGVEGAELSSRVILILGAANLVADGVSMGASNYLGIRSERAVARAAGVIDDGAGRPVAHGIVTFGAFVVVGSVPLIAYLAPISTASRFTVSCVLTLATQFVVGAARTLVTAERWWWSGLEMLAVGSAAAAFAYGIGRWLAMI